MTPLTTTIRTPPMRFHEAVVRGEVYIRKNELLRLLRETEEINTHPAARCVCKLLRQELSEAPRL